MSRSNWTKEEIDKLTKHYSDTPWRHLTKILPQRTRKAVDDKACSMRLKKSRVGCGHYNVDEDFFKKSSSEMAYILGVIAADGTVYINEVHGQHRLDITSIDTAWLGILRKAMKAEHPIYEECKLENGRRHVFCRLRITSKKLVNDLLEIGITPRKSLTLKFPTAPPQHLSHFVRGYFDGDGSIWFRRCKNRLRLHLHFCGTKDFLIPLNQVIKNEIGCAIKRLYINENIWGLQYNEREAEAVLHWMYRDATLYLPRKYQKISSYYEARKQMGLKHSSL